MVNTTLNVTNWSQMNSFENMLTAANANSPFWLGMMWLVTLVAVVLTSTFGIVAAMLTGSFIGFVMGFILAYMGLVAWKWVLMLLAILIGMILYVVVWGKGID